MRISKKEREEQKARELRFIRKMDKKRKYVKSVKDVKGYVVILDCYCCTNVLFFTSREKLDMVFGGDIVKDDIGRDVYGKPVCLDRVMSRSETLDYIKNNIL